MKRIKPYAAALIVIMTVMNLSACGTLGENKETTGGTTGAVTQTTATTTTNAAAETTTGTGATVESTGLINGVVNDVESGVDNLTGDSNGHPTTESTKAQ